MMDNSKKIAHLDFHARGMAAYLGNVKVVQDLVESFVQEGLLGATNPSMALTAAQEMADIFAGKKAGFTPVQGWEKDLCASICRWLPVDEEDTPANILLSAFLTVTEEVYKAVKLPTPTQVDARIRDVSEFIAHILLGTVDSYYLPAGVSAPQGIPHSSAPLQLAKKASHSWEDDLDDEVQPVGISRKWMSYRSDLREVQAKFLARLILEMETACVQAYRVRSASELHWEWDQQPRPWEIQEVTRFLEGAFACGFVCGDYKLKNWTNLDSVNARPELTINSMNHLEIRKYIHTVQRVDKQADGYSSPLLESLASGALQIAANRLLHDESLYQPY